ncbi:mitochondrial transcription termination factor family protein [Tasmannia lanceolata]|uniref:mitochondrial transcription termination factor family protein n=1 Tax=Tasmannia lanceolata TaxID=3420 RepID=UPI004063DFF9
MASLSHYFNSNPLSSLSPTSPSQNLSPSNFNGEHLLKIFEGRTKIRSKRIFYRDFVVFSTHSSSRILKSNRRSPYGHQLSPYEDDEEDLKDSRFSFDESPEISEFNDDLHTDPKSSSLLTEDVASIKPAILTLPKLAGQDGRLLKTERNLKVTYRSSDVRHGKDIPEKRNPGVVYHATNRLQNMDPVDTDGRGKLNNGNLNKSNFCQLSEDLDFDEKWFPLIDYLSTFGLKESHFIQIYERHMPCLKINVVSAQERLEFLLSVGVKHRDIRRILLRQPQILEYTVENNLKSHVAFLASLGVPDSRVGHIITAAPSLLSYSVEHSLKPTIQYLVEEVGIKRNDVSKVVQLSPQILVQRIDNSWTSRFGFLSKELAAPRDSIVKMVTKHPQLLHYSIEDGILPRINFLRSIGMQNSDILKVLTSLTQVLSLSLEKNLKPKYLYLVNELRNEVQSLTKYPMYLSLSLEQRIRPRHRFLVALKKAPKGPFPLSSFVPTDECFCQQWAGTSLDKYLAFRQTLLLSQFAKKYGRK